MANDIAPPTEYQNPGLPPVSNADADEDNLPQTLPIKISLCAQTQHSIELPDLPDEQPTRNLRFKARPEEMRTPAVRVPARLLSAAAVAAPMMTPGNRGRRSQQPASTLPAGARPRLRVLRGQKVSVEYPLYDGPNYIGRRVDEPVDIDLEEQEPADRIWTSRKHAVLHLLDGAMEIEDLNSLNGTFVNRTRVAPGAKRVLEVNDVIQIGTIQLRVMV